MSRFKVGDIVARKSYGLDILFKIVDIKNEGKNEIITLKGISYRIQADAPEADLILQPENRVNEHKMKMFREAEQKCKHIKDPKKSGISKKAFFRDTSKDSAVKFSRPGKVLHIDGDNDYLNTCLEQYKKFGIDAVGVFVPEKDQASSVYKLLVEHKPDILVLTGHDGLIKGSNNYTNSSNYRNSNYYIEAVKEARRYEKDYDGLVIFAGACQSMYNGIIAAGANYASSPYRVLIHALDPVFICQKLAFTGIEKVVAPLDVINNTITGVEGIGGIQTRGKYRDGFPLEPYSK